jgi:hypothetical protein
MWPLMTFSLLVSPAATPPADSTVPEDAPDDDGRGVIVEVIGARGASGFDPVRLGGLVRARLLPLVASTSGTTSGAVAIAADCNVTVEVLPQGPDAHRPTSSPGIVVRVARPGAEDLARQATIVAAEPGVVELELLREAPRLARAACAWPASSGSGGAAALPDATTAAECSRGVLSARCAPVDDPGGLPSGTPDDRSVLVGDDSASSVPLRRRADRSRFTRIAAQSGTVLRGDGASTAVDAVGALLGGWGVGDAEQRVGGLTSASVTAGGGKGLGSAEVLLAVGPTVEFELAGGNLTVGALAGPRIHFWWGTDATRPLPSGNRADLALLLHSAWMTRLGPVAVGASVDVSATQVYRDLRFLNDVLWRRENVGVTGSLIVEIWREGAGGNFPSAAE